MRVLAKWLPIVFGTLLSACGAADDFRGTEDDLLSTQARTDGIRFVFNPGIEKRSWWTTDPWQVNPDPVNSYWLARLSQIAYRAPPVQKEQLEGHGLDSSRAEFFQVEDTQALLVHAPRVDILAFRGTEFSSYTDLRTDTKIIRRPLPVKGSVHRGFDNTVRAIWKYLRPAVRKAKADRPGVPLYITGHSLGGAQATLAMMYAHLDECLDEDLFVQPARWQADCYERGLDVRGVYTFGSPKITNDEGAEWLGQDATSHGTALFRLVHARDPVPRMLVISGYRHPTFHHEVDAFLHYLDESGTMHHRRDVDGFGLLDGEFEDHRLPNYMRKLIVLAGGREDVVRSK